jgi:hypothetical protein
MLDKNWSVGVEITTNNDPTARSGDCHPWNTAGALWKKQMDRPTAKNSNLAGQKTGADHFQR